jgi:hypothetical protein
MARTESAGGRAGFAGWLNRTLLPWIGPPPLGPYTDMPEAEALAAQQHAVCPLCGELMSRHEIDRSGERTQVRHPDPEQVARAD